MSTKKILIRGIGADTSEAEIRSRLGRFGPVLRVEVIRDGRPADSSALVEMDVGDKAAEHLVFRWAACGTNRPSSAPGC